MSCPLGRRLSHAQRNEPGFTLRDYEFEQVAPLQIGPGLAPLLVQSIAADCLFLESIGVMDYSLLVGVHQRSAQSCTPRARTEHPHRQTAFELEARLELSCSAKACYLAVGGRHSNS